MKPKVGSLERLTNLTYGLKKWKKTQITKVRNESGDVTTASTKIERITR